MAQHDYIIANQSGAAFRSDLNNGLAAIVSQNSGAAQPSTTYAYQWWADTTAGLLKLRNAANNAWITIGTLADVNLGLLAQAGGTLTGALLLDDSGTVSAPALAFDGDTNTGIWRSAADTLNVATNGVENLEFGTTEVVFNDGGADIDFRIEGDTKANLFKVDAGADTVIIDGLTHPSADGTAGQSLVTNGSGVLSVASVPPPGSIFWFAANAAPTGYLKANGANVNRTTYAALFSAIGTTFGVGDGTTTFGLPDLRGEFIRGWDDGRGIDSGRAFGSAQAQAFLSHTHSFHPAYFLGSGVAAFDGNAITGNNVQGGYGNFAAIPSQTTGAAGGTETRPRNVALLAIIKF
jgi:microcystin-dependent protein